MNLTRVLMATAGTAALIVPALPAQAAHESNNKAELAGAATGTALVNYVAGRESEQWSANARVQGLEPGTYTYTVNGPAGIQQICTFTADGRGSDGCSVSSIDLGGFATAQIRDAAGAVVAEGTFERRGGNRN
jgi:hypothetical protein